MTSPSGRAFPAGDGKSTVHAAMPTINQLRCMLAVAETGSFTAGAARVSLSQPALSRSVREVERMLGVRLFERSTRAVALTPDGTEFAAVAREIVAHFDGGIARFRSYRSGMLGSLVVTTLPSMAAAVMPEIVARFGDEHPGVRVQLLEADASETLAQIREGRAEVALTERPDRVAAESLRDLRIMDVGEDAAVLVVREDHALAGRASVRWAELAGESLLLFPTGTSLRALSDEAFSEARVQTQHRIETPSVNAAAGMLRAGLGIAAMTRSVVPLLELAHPIAIPLTAPAIARPLAVVSRRRPALSPAASAFVTALQTFVARGTDRSGPRRE